MQRFADDFMAAATSAKVPPEFADQARRKALLDVTRACLRERLLEAAELTVDGVDALIAPLWRTRRLLIFSPIGRQPLRRFYDVTSIVVVDGKEHRPIRDASDLLGFYREELHGQIEPWLWDRLDSEMLNSQDNIATFLEFRRSWDLDLRRQAASAGAPTLWSWLPKLVAPERLSQFFEQWGASGHPFHPCRRSKVGFSREELVRYAPEFQGRAWLRWAALSRQVANAEDGRGVADPLPLLTAHFPALMADWERDLRRRGLDPTRFFPIPIHPWQEQHKVLSLFADEIAREDLILCDSVGLEAAATMSLRTLAPVSSPYLPHIKLPVAIQATSVPRTLGVDRALFGPRASRLVGEALDADSTLGQHVGILPELLAIHFAGERADDDRGRHLSTVLRVSPMSVVARGELPIVVAALLCTSPVTGQPLLAEIVEEAGARGGVEKLEYLRDYVELVVRGTVGLYLRHGMAAEAHQQNTLVVFDEAHRPKRLLFRDLADLKIHEPTMRRAGRSAVAPAGGLHPFSSDRGYVRNQLIYDVLQQHLGELIYVFARCWSCNEQDLWAMVRAAVEASLVEHRASLADAWEAERRAFLEETWLEKSLLRMRLAPSLDAITGPIGNPLASARTC